MDLWYEKTFVGSHPLALICSQFEDLSKGLMKKEKPLVRDLDAAGSVFLVDFEQIP